MPTPNAKPTVTSTDYAKSVLPSHPNDPRNIGLRWVRPGSRVLEVGCGHGAVTRMLREELGCTVVAIDLDSDVEAGVSPYADQFVCGDVTQRSVRQSLGDGFDHILLMDVLEHLAEPADTLRHLGAHLAPGGSVVVTLPNVVVWHVRRQILLGRFDYSNAGTLDRTHLRFFSRKGALDLLERAGFDLIGEGSSWNVPYVGRLLSLSLLAEVDERETRLRRRFPRYWKSADAALRLQKRINDHGWLKTLDAIGRMVSATAPGLWVNHFVLHGRPRR